MQYIYMHNRKNYGKIKVKMSDKLFKFIQMYK